jgi:pimeloyl-ACP methyl ester carboxylesterase
VTEIDLDTVDGRRLHAYSVGSGPFAVMWHHGTPNVGAPPEPLFAAADREVKEANAAVEADPDFLPADWAALEGEWGWFGGVVVPALANGPGPLIDDDLAYVVPWGFDPATIGARTLLVHGAGDRVVPAAHSEWLAHHIPGAELRIVPGAGHISVLAPAAVPALEWLAG